MGVMEAIKKGFGVATKSMGLVLLLFIFNLVGNLASMPFATVTPGTNVPPQTTAAALVFSIVFILVSIFVQGGALGLVRDAIKEGKMKLGGFVSYGTKYYVRLLGLGLLIILIIGIVALIAGLIVAATAPLKNNVITTVAIIIAMAISVIMGLLYFIPFTLSPYALVCDEMGVVGALKKSLEVGKKPFSRVFTLLLLFVLLILIALGVGFIIGFLVGLVTAVVPATVGKVLMAIATSIVNGYLGIVMTASFMVFYLGLTKKASTEKIF